MGIYITQMEIAAELEKANQLRKNVWRIWAFARKSNLLVLCGYNLPFDPDIFIAFHGTSRINLDSWTNEGRFVLHPPNSGTEANESLPNISMGEGDHFIEIVTKTYRWGDGDYHVIDITPKEKNKFVVCKGVSLVNVPKGAFI
jgi:hypothetical protein